MVTGVHRWFHQASEIHLQAAEVSGVKTAATTAITSIGLFLSEPTIGVSAGNHLPHPSHCFARFQGFASPIRWGVESFFNPRHTEPFRPRQWMWAGHLTIARGCACMAEQDLPAAITTMGAGLHLLQRDLILESYGWS